MPRHLISDAHEWINEIPAFHLSTRGVAQARRVYGNQQSKVEKRRAAFRFTAMVYAGV